MKVVEASAVIPLSPEEAWDFAFGDQLQRIVEAVDNIISVEDFQMRADGTPRYRMVRKVGPLTMSTISDYSVFERPYRTVSRALNPDAPFGGTFYTTSEPVAGGTRLSFRMEVEPQNALASVMLPVIRPLFARQLQQDLDDLVKAAATPQQGDQQRQMHVENSIMINRPVEEVFEYVSTPENDPTWVPVSLRHQRTLPGPMRVGMTTQEDLKFLGRTSWDTWEVIEYEPPTVVAYRATSGLASGAVVRVRCDPTEGGTRLSHAVEYEPRDTYFKALAPLLPRVVRRQLASMDRTLKKLLEGDTTPSPSGRAATAGSGALMGGVVAASVLAVLAFLLFRRRSGTSRRR